MELSWNARNDGVGARHLTFTLTVRDRRDWGTEDLDVPCLGRGGRR